MDTDISPLVFPGTLLGTTKEGFFPGEGTYEVDGKICASLVGTKSISEVDVCFLSVTTLTHRTNK